MKLLFVACFLVVRKFGSQKGSSSTRRHARQRELMIVEKPHIACFFEKFINSVSQTFQGKASSIQLFFLCLESSYKTRVTVFERRDTFEFIKTNKQKKEAKSKKKTKKSKVKQKERDPKESNSTIDQKQKSQQPTESTTK